MQLLSGDELVPRANRFFIYSIITPILATPIVLVRLWIRGFITRSLGLDDALLAFSLVCYIGLSISDIFTALLGLGVHEDDLLDENAIPLWKAMYANGIFVYLCTITLRLSICLFFLRITPVKWQRWLIYAIMFFNTVIQLISLFWFNIFYCDPIAAYWADIPTATCVDNDIVTGMLYVQYILATVSDWTLSALPLLFLRNTSMNRQTKMVTMALLGMGALASISSIMCIVYVQTDSDGDDYSYTVYPFYTVQPIEPFIGIMATSFATYRPLFRRLQAKYYTNGSKSGQTGPTAVGRTTIGGSHFTRNGALDSRFGRQHDSDTESETYLMTTIAADKKSVGSTDDANGNNDIMVNHEIVVNHEVISNSNPADQKEMLSGKSPIIQKAW